MATPIPLVGVSAHPRVAGSIRRAKSVGGMVAFALVLAISEKNGAPFATACSRALAGGLIGYLVAWTAAVAVWRHVLRARTRQAVAAATARRTR